MITFIMKVVDLADSNELVVTFKILQKLLFYFKAEDLQKKEDCKTLFAYLWHIEPKVLDSNDENFCMIYAETSSKLLLSHLERTVQIGGFEDIWLSFVQRFVHTYQIAKQRRYDTLVETVIESLNNILRIVGNLQIIRFPSLYSPKTINDTENKIEEDGKQANNVPDELYKKTEILLETFPKDRLQVFNSSTDK